MFCFITFILEDEHRLSLGMLMHVKCIHELCIILLIFQSYLHHIRVISLFYIDFGNISQFPYFSRINPTLAENPIFYILMFHRPKRRLNDLIFCGDYILEGIKRRSQGSARNEVRGGFWWVPRGQIPWPRDAPPFPPRGSDAVRFHLRAFVLI